MKYRKKPVEIEAVKFEYTTVGLTRLREFCGDCLGNVRKDRHPDALAEAEIRTLEDGETLKVTHIASEGDYIIKGVKEELYPCRRDIFEMTYEKVNDE